MWDTDYKNFPQTSTLKEQILFLLEFAILAPSTHNIQPWQFRVLENSCDILLDPGSMLPHGDSEKRYAHIGIGATLEHIMIAGLLFSMNPNVVFFPEDGVVARVVFRDGMRISNDKATLLNAMKKRVNIRGKFQKKRISKEILGELEQCSVFKAGTFYFVTDQRKVDKLAELTARGLRRAHRDKAFRQEMAQKINHNLSPKRIGIPGYTMNMPLLFSFILPYLLYHRDISKVLAKLNRMSVASAPLVCVVTSKKHDHASWVEIGMVAERVMLMAVSHGLTHSIYVASTEFDDLRGELQNILETEEFPDFFFCLGYMNRTMKHSPRMAVDEKLIL